MTASATIPSALKMAPTTGVAAMLGHDSSASVPVHARIDESNLKEDIQAALWSVVDRHGWILSATETGSFLSSPGLEGISDIDFVVIVDRLNAARFEAICEACQTALTPVLANRGFKLRINPTLGPLKFNDENTAVLHLMLYSREAHVEHVIQSPFTCFDWQRSPVYRKQSMAEIYPVFALQPHHFLSTRRSISGYLKDYRAGVVSYRELVCDETSYREERREQPMSNRARHEFAYHILHFLMQNVLKLMHRSNEVSEGKQLVDDFLRIFPLDGEDVRRFYSELEAKKKSLDFSWPVPDLDRRLEVFVRNFESQFTKIFFTEATRHVIFRHARTALNGSTASGKRFVGRSNPEIDETSDQEWAPLLECVGESAAQGFVSPLFRCQQTYQRLARYRQLPEPTVDNRLIEIDYGGCEGLSVGSAREAYPELFAAWQRGEDPAFPQGEATDDVARRALAFVDDRWTAADGPTVACTHNVVLRTLIGHGLQVPRRWWYRLQIPHLAPVTFVQTRSHGWFVDLEESVEKQIFADFATGKSSCN
jgi:broad specificity phosphatase PhoE